MLLHVTGLPSTIALGTHLLPVVHVSAFVLGEKEKLAASEGEAAAGRS